MDETVAVISPDLGNVYRSVEGVQDVVFHALGQDWCGPGGVGVSVDGSSATPLRAVISRSGQHVHGKLSARIPSVRPSLRRRLGRCHRWASR